MCSIYSYQLAGVFWLCFLSLAGDAQADFTVKRAPIAGQLEIAWGPINGSDFVVQYHGNDWNVTQPWEILTTVTTQIQDNRAVIIVVEPFQCSGYSIRARAKKGATVETSNSIKISSPSLVMPENSRLSVLSMVLDPTDRRQLYNGHTINGSVFVTVSLTKPYRIIPELDSPSDLALPWSSSDLVISLLTMMGSCRKPDLQGLMLMPEHIYHRENGTFRIRIDKSAMIRGCDLMLMVDSVVSESCGLSTVVRTSIILRQKIDCKNVANSDCFKEEQAIKPYCSIKNFESKTLKNGDTQMSWEPKFSQRHAERFGRPKYFAIRLGDAEKLENFPLLGVSLLRMKNVLETYRTCELELLSECNSSLLTKTITSLKPRKHYGVQICAVYDSSKEFPDIAIQQLQTYSLNT